MAWTKERKQEILELLGLVVPGPEGIVFIDKNNKKDVALIELVTMLFDAVHHINELESIIRDNEWHKACE